MKPPEAIEVLTDLLGDGPYWPEEKRRKAVKLGIEALKWVDLIRPTLPAISHKLLPGETEEMIGD